MLKILQPESAIYHNFKCGEIFCLNPATYNVTCCLCRIKVNIEQFPEHFQEEHLAQMQIHPPDWKLEVRESIDTEFVKAGDLIKSEDNSDGGDDEPGIDTEILGNMGDDLVDEQPIDFDELNPMEAGEISKSLLIDDNENNEHDNSTKEIGNKTGESTDPDWQNDDSSDEGSQKQNVTDTLRHPCPDCTRSYKTRRTMLAHHRANHNPNRKKKPPKFNFKYKCDECGEKFRLECHLRGHRWKHTGIICDICGKTFTQVGNLVRHKIRHTGIKDYKCEECGNEFFTEKELKIHKLRHTGERPVVCEICGRRFREQGVYTAHMRRHTGERPAKCEVCNKAFYSFHDLNIHAVTHSTARPFVCDVCGSTFQRKKSLRVHKKLHSKDRNHECKVCGKAFTQSSGLNAHMRTHSAAPSNKTIGMSANNKITAIAEELMGAHAGTSSGSAMNLTYTTLNSETNEN